MRLHSSRLRPRVLGALAAVPFVGQLAAQNEVAVPSFDTDKAKGSYVLALPPAHDPKVPTALILDFHGAIHPSQKGANVTYQRLWSKFVKEMPFPVLGINSRTRAWNMTNGAKNDTAYALHVLAEVHEKHTIKKDEIYLAGFSSGSDFLCKGGLQLRAGFAGSLVVCPGPSTVLGLRGGELLKVKDHPFYFVTGAEDYIRKGGAWDAFVALDTAGGTAMYREVPGVGHAFPPTAEYSRALRYLRILAGKKGKVDFLGLAEQAMQGGDWLLASTHLRGMKSAKAKKLLAEIEATAKKHLAAAGEISWKDEPGRAYEAWWGVMTQFYRFPRITERAKQVLAEDHGISRRDLYKARHEFFRGGGRAPVKRRAPSPGRQSTFQRRSAAAKGPWSFDRYLSYDEVTERLRLLAQENPQRVRLYSMGKSIQGRDLWVCEITDHNARPAARKPAAYVQGGIHGNEVSSVMATLYFAWQMGANPDRRRSVGRLLRDTTFYVAPAVNPDAVQDFVTRPNSLWRPRFNSRPHDADGDGRIDEDPYEDLNGDGQVSQMYAKDPKGVFVLKNGRMVRDASGKITPRFRHIGREGIDNDLDGRYSEDPVGGVNLNRNFPVGFRARRDFEGFRGKGPASEPETQAIIRFVKEHANIALFLDYHNAANCVFYWIGKDGKSRDVGDFSLMTAIAGRAHEKLGYAPRPLDHDGVGLSVAWAYGEMCIPACIVELDAGDPKSWGDDVFVAARKFEHPQLGEVWIGNDHKKLPKRNPHPSDIYDQVQRNWDFLRDELKGLPQLVVNEPQVVRSERGFAVTGRVTNKGAMPMETARAKRLGRAHGITITVRGARVSGSIGLPPLDAGMDALFHVELADCEESVTLVVAHPRGGTFELPVRRRRVPTMPVKDRGDYRIEAGYKTVDTAVPGKIHGADNGPRFQVPHGKKELRVAVLLGEFTGKKHIVPVQKFADSMFGAGGSYRGDSHTGQAVYGSVRDFYLEMSYAQMDVTGRVFDWIELSGKYIEYRKASFGSSKFRAALEAAVLAKHGDDALDGFDGVIFVWAGNPVHRVSNLWPMRVPLKHRPGVIAFKMGEFYRGQMAPIGVACHEMGHTFGVNDKYGLGAPKLPMGRWCLMCKGTHGAGQSMQHRPFHLCAWCKMVIGWLEPKVIDPSVSQKLALRPVLSSPRECYRVLLKPDGSEYLLLENRRREGFMTELPSAGLVVLKVGPNTRPSAPQKQVQLMPAHGLGPAARSELQKLDEIAWPQPGKMELLVDGVRLSNIRLVGDVVYFEVGRTK